MSERGTAPKAPEDAPVSGAEPTVAAGLASGPAGKGAAATPLAMEPTLARAELETSPTDPPPPGVPQPVSAPRASKRVTDWTGREIAGRYRVLERLGEGGMGVVYVAEHLSLKKKVAFKVIHPELAAQEDLLLRFQREALATGQLDHPHITAAIDFGDLEGGGAFMVMPWVRGHSLQHELDERGKLDFRRAALICSQIADALSAAHAMGIVHRDLKPDNVLLEKRSDGSEAAKVLDFGVASLAGRAEGLSMQARPLTQAGTILGTPGYMSPEQASAGDVDHRTDIYALGVILWELCRGERLFSGDDITQIFAKQFKSVPAPLDLGLSSAARELSGLVTRMLAWDKNERPSTAAEVRDTLRRIASSPEARLPALNISVSRFPPVLRNLPLPVPLEPYRRYLPHAILALLLAVIVMAWPGSKTESVTVLPEKPVETASSQADKPRRESKKEKERQAASERSETREEKTPAGDTIIEPAAPPRSEASAAAGVAGEMSEALDNMMNSRSANSRRNAAKWLRKHAAEAPHYVTLLAELELNTRCNDKREVVEQMAELSDPRVLPALERLAETPRRGCGLLRLTDCFACLRRELDQTIGALEQIKR